jgi:dimethylhistidine N-methyltransferase
MTLRSPSQAPAPPTLRDEVIAGLRAKPPELPAKLHYDARGSALFEQICELPEYDLARVEASIMIEHAPEIALAIGPGAMLIEPGAGACIKTQILLESLADCAGFVPIEISGEMLEATVARVAAVRPDLHVTPVHGDFTRYVLPESGDEARRVIYFPGSTIGNFTEQGQRCLLDHFSRSSGPGGLLLIGFDMVRPIGVMEAAYNDLAGVTAEFNFNVIDRLRGEFGLAIDRDWFEFSAEWDDERQAVLSYLHALRDVQFDLEGEPFRLPQGGRILMEESHKYTRERIHGLAADAGLSVLREWTDRHATFTVALMRPGQARTNGRGR